MADNAFHYFPALLSALMLISAECFAQTQTYVLGEHQENWMYGGPTRDGTKKFIYPTGRTVYFSRTTELAPANVTINWNANHGSSTEDDSLFVTFPHRAPATRYLWNRVSFLREAMAE